MLSVLHLAGVSSVNCGLYEKNHYLNVQLVELWPKHYNANIGMFSFALNVYLPLTEENPFIGLRCLVSSNLSRKHERRKSLILDDTSRKL